MPVGARFSAPVQTGPGTQPASCTMGTGSFLEVKSRRGVTLTPNHLLVPWSWKGRAIPLIPLWAVRPVQSLGAGTSVNFTFTLPSHVSRGFYTSISSQVSLFWCSSNILRGVQLLSRILPFLRRGTVASQPRLLLRLNSELRRRTQIRKAMVQSANKSVEQQAPTVSYVNKKSILRQPRRYSPF